MAYETGDIKVFNPNKEISKEITLEILIRHRDALKQARTGELPGIALDELNDNKRKMNQVRALSLIIASQREMVTISRPIIYFRSLQKWNRKNREDDKKEEMPFEKEDNDYNNLLFWLDFLRECERSILNAEKTKRLDDDFMISRPDHNGEKLDLTTNFYEMLEDLEKSFEAIYLLMLTNKIVSAGIEEDEEMTYKEKEEEAVKRIVEA